MFRNPTNTRTIQTPSHLGLFEKVNNSKTNNQMTDYRDSMQSACDRKQLNNAFFHTSNVDVVKRTLQQSLKHTYNITDILDHSTIINLMTHFYLKFDNQPTTIQQLNSYIFAHGPKKLYNDITSNKQYLHDRNNVPMFTNPQVMSNKIEKQLPQFNFI